MYGYPGKTVSTASTFTNGGSNAAQGQAFPLQFENKKIPNGETEGGEALISEKT